MQSLAKLQTSFYKALLEQSIDSLGFSKSTVPLERLAIYRQTIFSNLENALALTFSGVWSLVGEKCANTIAYAFSQHEGYLPKSGSLDDYGAEFPDFIASIKSLESYPYLSDYARYEWLKHQVEGAVELESLNPTRLLDFSEAQLEALCFEFKPSCGFIRSEFDLAAIEEVVENKDAHDLSLSDQGAYGIVIRREDTVFTLWVTKALWLFVDALAQGETLAHSVAMGLAEDPTLSVGASLGFILEKQLIHRIRN